MKHQSLVNALLLLGFCVLGGFLWQQQRELRELRSQVDLAARGAAKPQNQMVTQRSTTGVGKQHSGSDTPGAGSGFTGALPAETTMLQKTLEGSGLPAAEISTSFRSEKFLGGRVLGGEGETDYRPLGGGLETPEIVAGKGPRWGHQQAAGPPDTPNGGDLITAWAPRSYGIGEQWLEVKYDRKVEIGAINVHETYNPGAISKVTARMADGSEKLIWEGQAKPEEAPVETSIPVPPGIRSDQVRIYLDTNRVRSWPEIDAVELVGKDGSRQWASSTTASSYYGEGR